MKHQYIIEQRIYAMHQVIADRIKDDPALLHIARTNISRWRANGGDKPWMHEWERIIAKGPASVIAVLRDSGEDATRLRSSTPFVGILTQKERNTFYSPEFTKIVEEREQQQTRTEIGR